MCLLYMHEGCADGAAKQRRKDDWILPLGVSFLITGLLYYWVFCLVFCGNFSVSTFIRPEAIQGRMAINICNYNVLH